MILKFVIFWLHYQLSSGESGMVIVVVHVLIITMLRQTVT